MLTIPATVTAARQLRNRPGVCALVDRDGNTVDVVPTADLEAHNAQVDTEWEDPIDILP